jgi:hypothetical protein
MITINADLSGLKTFEEFRRDFPRKVKEIIGNVAADLREKVVGETPFDIRSKDTHAKESWGDIIEHEAGFSFGSDLVYMPVLEYGRYPNVGEVHKGDIRTRTVKTGTGVYSRQAVEGWIRKYTESDEVLNAIAERVIKAFKEDLA